MAPLQPSPGISPELKPSPVSSEMQPSAPVSSEMRPQSPSDARRNSETLSESGPSNPVEALPSPEVSPSPLEPSNETTFIQPSSELLPVQPSPEIKPLEPSPEMKTPEPSPEIKLLEPSPEMKPLEPSLEMKPLEPSPEMKPLEPSPEIKPLVPSPAIAAAETASFSPDVLEAAQVESPGVSFLESNPLPSPPAVPAETPSPADLLASPPPDEALFAPSEKAVSSSSSGLPASSAPPVSHEPSALQEVSESRPGSVEAVPKKLLSTFGWAASSLMSAAAQGVAQGVKAAPDASTLKSLGAKWTELMQSSEEELEDASPVSARNEPSVEEASPVRVPSPSPVEETAQQLETIDRLATQLMQTQERMEMAKESERLLREQLDRLATQSRAKDSQIFELQTQANLMEETITSRVRSYLQAELERSLAERDMQLSEVRKLLAQKTSQFQTAASELEQLQLALSDMETLRQEKGLLSVQLESTQRELQRYRAAEGSETAAKETETADLRKQVTSLEQQLRQSRQEAVKLNCDLKRAELEARDGEDQRQELTNRLKGLDALQAEFATTETEEAVQLVRRLQKDHHAHKERLAAATTAITTLTTELNKYKEKSKELTVRQGRKRLCVPLYARLFLYVLLHTCVCMCVCMYVCRCV